MWLAGQVSVFEVIISIFANLIVIFVCFPVREYARALIAKLCGDDTAEREGRLTLNPFVHIDPFGALMLFLCNIGYSTPTPVSPARCKKVSMKTATVLLALSGPIANMIMAFILLIPYRIIGVQYAQALNNPEMAGQAQVLYWAALAFSYAAQINVFLMLFNLIPVPPFNGYYAIAPFLPANAVNFMERNWRFFQIAVLLLIFSGVLSRPLSFLTGVIMNFLQLPLSFIR